MVNEIRVKRAYVDACERHWSQKSLSNDHTSFNSLKVLDSKKDGKQYLNGLGNILNLSGADGWDMFQRTLCFNIEFSGASATEFKQLEFKVGGKHGIATYLLVATNVDYTDKVTVCYAYHHINQRILDYGRFTLETADMTLDWMRAKSCQSLAAMLPPNMAPQLIYE
ncbi:unnamed protein product [Rotaria sp. Silwood1]|nr:unnamed protein product [Rotaria sp. Silwood1]CAF1369166.1 unnamed protein product [Rotaria sp. Silwood1]CAF3560463.1 unnamed protein product [Rotaria sp. Silwood1]CAF4859688.1 unnamed protein product [Rotaria sp. Silwood1]